MLKNLFNIFLIALPIIVTASHLIVSIYFNNAVGIITWPCSLLSAIVIFKDRERLFYDSIVKLKYPVKYSFYYVNPGDHNIRSNLLKFLDDSGIDYFRPKSKKFHRVKKYYGVTLFFKDQSAVDYLKLSGKLENFDVRHWKVGEF